MLQIFSYVFTILLLLNKNVIHLFQTIATPVLNVLILNLVNLKLNKIKKNKELYFSIYLRKNLSIYS